MARELYSAVVYTQETDDLTDKIAALIERETAHLPKIDRSVIVAACLANIACWCDGKTAAPITTDPDGATGRLHLITNSWG